ncbi:MAG: hypothetical protein AAGI38_14355 [Bacteroidota bacterium]
MKIVRSLSFLLIPVLLSGCANVYFPNEIQTPSVKKREMEASLTTGSNLLSLSAATSPVDHLVVTLSGGYVYNATSTTVTVLNETTETLVERQQLMADVGIGGYIESPEGHARVTLIGGYAFGRSDLDNDIIGPPDVDQFDIDTRFDRPYGLLIFQGATSPSRTGTTFTGGFAVRAGWFEFSRYDVRDEGILEDDPIPAPRWKYEPALFMKLSFSFLEDLTLQVKGQFAPNFPQFPAEDYGYRPYLLFGGLGVLW